MDDATASASTAPGYLELQADDRRGSSDDEVVVDQLVEGFEEDPDTFYEVAAREVLVERMLPHQVDAALAGRSVVYLPLGSIEYHSLHLPLGLDGLTAHGVCTAAARRTGGIVLPTLWWGTGGTHTSYPWTIMAATADPLAELVTRTLTRLADLDVDRAVLFTGHFADEQLALVDQAAADWNARGRAPYVVPLAVNRSDAPLDPDHAGEFETLLVHALHPDLVDLDLLPDLADIPFDPPGPAGDFEHRHSPGHPLRGIMGADPRTVNLTRSAELLDQVVSWTCRQVDVAPRASGEPPAAALEGQP